MAQPTAELQAGTVEAVGKWLDVAQKLGAGHIRVFGGDIPKGATEDQAVVWAVRHGFLASRNGFELKLTVKRTGREIPASF